MTTVNVIGIGKVTIHLIDSEPHLQEQILAFNKAAILSPQAIILFKKSDDVSLSGRLYLPKKEKINLFTGGVLNNAYECITASLALIDDEYEPSDFALA